MKKEKVFQILICIAALCLPAWRISFGLTKHADDFPSLERLQEDRLDEIIGYKRGTVIQFWEEPDEMLNETQEVWSRGDGVSIVLTFGKDGKVKDAVWIGD